MSTSRNEPFSLEFTNETSLLIHPEQTILDASLQAGIPHFHACGGKGQCSTCRVLVEEGEEQLAPPNQIELKLAQRLRFPKGVRLACQTTVTGGPIKLHRLVRDETDLKMLADSKSHRMAQSLGEERELALFFLDIRNFTPFAEAHLPYDVIHILNRFFALVRNAVQACGGRPIEVAGDSLYAVFGLDAEIKQAVAAGVTAGKRILEDIEKFNKSYLKVYFGHRLAVGIGLHVGRVICGDIGIGVGGALSVIGYPVNVAARIQAATKEVNNSFLISAAAFRLLGSPPPAWSTTVNLKGISEPCQVYLLGKAYQE